MINQTTLKQYGEWDIKLISRIKQDFVKILIILCVTLIIIYFIATKSFLGEQLGKVVSQSFIVFQNNNGIESSYIDWTKFKTFVISLILISVIIIALLSYIISKIIIKKNISIISEIIASYFDEDDPKIPDEYLEIKNGLDKLKIINQDNKQSYNQEIQKNKDLITYLAHDLKTPLASIIGYLSLLIESPDLTPDMRIKYLNTILDKANRLDYLTDELSDITRFSFYNITIDSQDFDLVLLFKQIGEEFYPLLKEKQQQLLLDLPDSYKMVGDPSKLVRVFNNLLKNAIAYGRENSSITLKLIANDNLATIILTNHSDYLSINNLNDIFEKFYRFDSSRSSKTGGSGLGLSIAKEIIEAHHGDISVATDSDVIRFKISLPKKYNK